MTRYEMLLETLRHAGPPAEALSDKPAPWESSVQATCECLSWRGCLNNLDRRHAEDRLGETLYADFPVHTRSALVAAHSLMDMGVISEDELRAKMSEVRARLERE